MSNDNSNQINLGNASHVNINIGDGNTQGVNAPASNVNPIPKSKPIFAIPIQRNPYFTGRQQILKDIKKNIVKQPVVLTGLGGVGKSHTAAHFAYLHEQDYQAVFWVVADTQQNLINNFGQLARYLTDESVTELDKQIALVQTYLSQRQDWLLIIDNLEPEINWREIWLKTMRGQVLLTSRACVIDEGVHSLDVEKMSVDESRDMILRRVLQKQQLRKIDELDKHAAQALAVLLDGLPLALSQACAYIQQTKCGIAAYVQLYEVEGYKLMAKRGKVSEHDHPEPVATTWKLSYKKLQAENPATIELLKVCAFLDADEIPEEIFSQEYDLLAFNDMLGSIQQFSLLQRDATNKMLSMHRLVQEDIRADLTSRQQKEYALRALRLLAAVFWYDRNDIETWSKPERLLASSLKLSSWIDILQFETDESARFLQWLAFYLDNVKANYSQALPLYERSLAIREKVLGEHHPLVATSLNNLALLYDNQGKYEQALPLYERSLAILQAVFDENHPTLQTVKSNYEGCLRDFEHDATD